MNLIALRTEVLNHGFDPNLFSSRVNQYLNDAQALIARRVDWYVDEAANPFPTVTGTSLYPFPADFARARSLFNTDQNLELQFVGLEDIDRSQITSGMPRYYAVDGANVHLYPTPDNVYNLELRYWKMPADLVADTDVPTLPAAWHRLLWEYAVAVCYQAEDDMQTGQQWEQKFNNDLAMFAADVKFANADGPLQAKGMWDQGRGLSPAGWTFPGVYDY